MYKLINYEPGYFTQPLAVMIEHPWSQSGGVLWDWKLGPLTSRLDLAPDFLFFSLLWASGFLL